MERDAKPLGEVYPRLRGWASRVRCKEELSFTKKRREVMIDDRICIFYVAERVQDILGGDPKCQRAFAEEFLRELNHNIGVNTRWKRNNPEALTADFPPIETLTKRGRPKGKKNG